MAHKVICGKCGKQFDRDVEQAVKISARRYAHYACFPEGELVPLPQKKEKQEDPDLVKLKDYISKLYGDKANWALIMKQIKKFHTEKNFSYSGMLKSLVYFYDVQKNSIDGSNGGIGIIEYCYQAAYQYYYNLFIIQSQNKGKDIPSIVTKVKEVTIPIPRVPKKKGKFFHFLNEELEENE